MLERRATLRLITLKTLSNRPKDQASQDMLRQMVEAGHVRDLGAKLVSLSGGVSSDIYRVEDGEHIFVVKRALPKLRVQEDWRADVSRNRFELAYIRQVAEFLPQSVPRILFAEPAQAYFAMEYFDATFSTWKERLLSGSCEPSHAINAARTLATIHRVTWEDSSIRSRFETTKNFHALRTAPYLLTTAERHPRLREQLEREVERLERTRRCLVHGDYSPKNLLIGDDRFVVIDCEVAWFGDPAFDVAFLLNHLVLKALYLPAHRADCIKLCEVAWSTYHDTVGAARAHSVRATTPRLLLMLMLARVDGKSPVEYLTEPDRQRIRDFAYEHIGDELDGLGPLLRRWEAFLNQ